MNYEPKDDRVARVWRRLSPDARNKRWEKAMRRLELIRALDARGENETERSAARQLDAGVDRTTIRRWSERYNSYGSDGLIDARMGPRPLVDADVHGATCTLRQADPNIAAAAMVAHVKQRHGIELSESTVTTVLPENGLNRRR
jgi:transposase